MEIEYIILIFKNEKQNTYLPIAKIYLLKKLIQRFDVLL